MMEKGPAIKRSRGRGEHFMISTPSRFWSANWLGFGERTLTVDGAGVGRRGSRDGEPCCGLMRVGQRGTARPATVN